MNEQFCSYEIAVKLKELGFDEPCLAYFESIYDGLTQTHIGRLVLGKQPEHLQNYKQLIYIFGQNNQLAPLWQQAISFLKERKVLVAERWDGWEYGAYEWDYFIYCKTKEQAILKAIELST